MTPTIGETRVALDHPLLRLRRLIPRGRIALLLAAIFLIAIAVAAVFGGLITPHDPELVSLLLRNKPPGTAAQDGGLPYLLGTDPLGRDNLSRIMTGARVTLAVGIASVILSGVFGTIVGMISGFYRGRVDEFLMRLADIQLSFPSLLVALLVLYVLGGSFFNVIIILAILRWVVYARFARGQVISVRERLFIEAAMALGASNTRILFRHILPNIFGSIFVLGVLEVATVILAESSLSFLGLGVQPPAISWGQMLSSARPYIREAWWLTTFPGLAILLTTLSLNIVGNWIRNRDR